MAKVNLAFQHDDIRNGYLNITPWPPKQLPENLPEATQIVVGQVGNLNDILSDNSCEEMIFNPLFNLIRPIDIIDLLKHWKNKLSEGGLLKLSFVDIRLLARFVYQGTMSLQDIHNLIIGPHKEYENVMDTETIRNTLEAIGFNIESISNNNYIVSVEARK